MRILRQQRADSDRTVLDDVVANGEGENEELEVVPREDVNIAEIPDDDGKQHEKDEPSQANQDSSAPFGVSLPFFYQALKMVFQDDEEPEYDVDCCDCIEKEDLDDLLELCPELDAEEDEWWKSCLKLLGHCLCLVSFWSCMLVTRALLFGTKKQRFLTLLISVPVAVLLPVYFVRATQEGEVKLFDSEDDSKDSWSLYLLIGIYWILTSYMWMLVLVFPIAILCQLLVKLRTPRTDEEVTQPKIRSQLGNIVFPTKAVSSIPHCGGRSLMISFVLCAGAATAGLIFVAVKMDTVAQEDVTKMEREKHMLAQSFVLALWVLALQFLLALVTVAAELGYPMYCHFCLRVRKAFGQNSAVAPNPSVDLPK